MARIDPIPVREWPPSMRDALAAMVPPEPRHPQPNSEGRPKALNMLGTFAHHPVAAKAFLTFNGHVLRSTLLDLRTRELLVLRVAARRECRYEWFQHVVIGGDVGLAPDEIDRIASDPPSSVRSSEWSDEDAALLRSVDELVDDGVIGEATWAALSDRFGAGELLDLIFTVGLYDLLAGIMRSFDLELDDDLLEYLAANDLAGHDLEGSSE